MKQSKLQKKVIFNFPGPRNEHFWRFLAILAIFPDFLASHSGSNPKVVSICLTFLLACGMKAKSILFFLFLIL